MRDRHVVRDHDRVGDVGALHERAADGLGRDDFARLAVGGAVGVGGVAISVPSFPTRVIGAIVVGVGGGLLAKRCDDTADNAVREEECKEQYERDSEICRRVKKRECWAQAAD